MKERGRERERQTDRKTVSQPASQPASNMLLSIIGRTRETPKISETLCSQNTESTIALSA